MFSRYFRNFLLTIPPAEMINPLNVELNPIRHLLALAGAHHFVDVSRIRVKGYRDTLSLEIFLISRAKFHISLLFLPQFREEYGSTELLYLLQVLFYSIE
jgi:hypothetical protein